tara:strand:- start:182 stop:433 length:252 start_codon:yes stop_codon:yes gene_type:complete
MPRYEYQCDSCKEEYVISHPYKETVTGCIRENCNGKISKIMSKVVIRKNKIQNGKVGSVVNKSIEDFKEDLQREKDTLRKERK